MQRVTNCVYIQNGEVLLLQKPRRNWWVAPGGKMEQGESVKEAVTREFREETGIFLNNPKLKGVFTFLIKEGDEVISEWMMFTFLAEEGQGDLYQESEEGKLAWHSIENIPSLQMAPGDIHILEYMVHGDGMIFGTFIYTPDFELISYRLDPS
ncbi:8-oxo-dGTP diphosphatase [Bacillus oleivorans]|uniref:8-oxo-dGTP diphosphatase n=1 Tax=Bacillus oleivorans TaxID=1448271 RepID=A0A285CYI0_9BACI|nr:8-oxo-dGTP diphosphatase [Bacillus oleivorans]SNX72589.1 8-oxo-dGTP diphosphatase [Bacillus oleivorans]